MGAPSPSIDRRAFLSAVLGLAGNGLWAPRSLADPEPSEAKSLDQMIGEMIIMGFWGSEPDSKGASAISTWLSQGAIGGVIFFTDNLSSPEGAMRLTHAFYKAASPQVPFLCVDQEGGAIARLRPTRGFVPLPAAQSVATTSTENAEALYERTAGELHRIGLNVNFGPVVDLSLNSQSHIIEGLGRSFSADPAVVIEYAKDFIDAHRRHHIITALKHFPGHGSTAADSHLTLPDITNDWRQEELRPFKELIGDKEADMVMVGHLVHADLTEEGRPASLSVKAVQDLLRGTLGYEGVVVSDDMQMGALRRFFLPDDSILLGIEAGLDLFIYSNRQHPDPRMPERFHAVVKAAVGSGRLTQARIEASSRRIAALKTAMRLKNPVAVGIPEALSEARGVHSRLSTTPVTAGSRDR